MNFGGTKRPKLGRCCACGGVVGVRNVLMLHQKAPMPGRGWGCVICDLPSDGAVAVTCDLCFDMGLEKRPLRWACKGYPAEDGRVPIGELAGSHEHDMARHAALKMGRTL